MDCLSIFSNADKMENENRDEKYSCITSLWKSGATLAVEHRHWHYSVLLLGVEVLHQHHRKLDVVRIFSGQPTKVLQNALDVGRA